MAQSAVIDTDIEFDQTNKTIVGKELATEVLNGRPLQVMRVRLPSYRALPLCCVQNIRLSIDGQEVARNKLALRLNGVTFTLDELPLHNNVWWWILDEGEVLIDLDGIAGAPELIADLTITTIEPYLTVGRFPFNTSSRKRMSIKAQGEVA